MAEGPVPVRDAATIMVVRDSEPGPGMEVLMLRRNARSTWVGGAYLFPGGAVDAEDLSGAAAGYCSGRDDAEASRLLGVGAGGIGSFVAAIRECFEEAGLLLALGPGGPLDFGDPEVADRFDASRRKLNARATTFLEICAAESLTLDLGRLGYFSHWITPEGSPRRYDTRFFVAELPKGQIALHDDTEVVDSIWIEPRAALERHKAGEIDMLFPTMKNLQAIARFDRASALLEATAASEVPTIEPRITVDEAGGVRILLPGDAGFDEATGLPEGASFPDTADRMRPQR